MRKDIQTVQTLVNTGLAWELEGHVGRTCMDAIQNGDVMLGVDRFTDYYGSLVPSRTDVKPGTKGSRDYVLEHHDEAYVLELETLDHVTTAHAAALIF